MDIQPGQPPEYLKQLLSAVVSTEKSAAPASFK